MYDHPIAWGAFVAVTSLLATSRYFRRNARLCKKMRRKKRRKSGQMQCDASPAQKFTIAIDLSFENNMCEVEIRSLCKQIQLCYGLCRRSEIPAQLVLASLENRATSSIKRNLQIYGVDKWQATTHEKSLPEIFAEQASKGKLVYLSPDADEVLESVDPNTVYAIGGLVDRQVAKDYTKKQAMAFRVPSRRLPIQEYMELTTSQVLNLNTVAKILLCFLRAGRWDEAIRSSLPKRKQLSVIRRDNAPSQISDLASLKALSSLELGLLELKGQAIQMVQRVGASADGKQTLRVKFCTLTTDELEELRTRLAKGDTHGVLNRLPRVGKVRSNAERFIGALRVNGDVVSAATGGSKKMAHSYAAWKILQDPSFLDVHGQCS